MIASKVKIVIVVCSALLAACTDPTGIDDLAVELTLSRASVHPSEPLEARVVVTNPTARSITLTTSDSCPATLEATKDGQRVELAGTAYGCLTVISHFEIAPHD